MSYILDALQKNATEAESAAPTAIPGTVVPTQHAANGLSLPWKLAIGGVLIANVALVYLWRADRAEDPSSAQPSAGLATNNQTTTYTSNPNSRPGKIPLPGILSPRDLPPPTAAPSTRSPAASYNGLIGTESSGALAPGTARTFKPTGRKITITGEPDANDLGYNIASTPEPRPIEAAPTPRQTINRTIPLPEPVAAPSRRARSASTLSELSDSAREALYTLSFSFHIYGAESDLRSVGVNGQRTTEGESIETAGGKRFTISEITDNGAIIEFDHNGESVSVAIPVMEDWKDS